MNVGHVTHGGMSHSVCEHMYVFQHTATHCNTLQHTATHVHMTFVTHGGMSHSVCEHMYLVIVGAYVTYMYV